MNPLKYPFDQRII